MARRFQVVFRKLSALKIPVLLRSAVWIGLAAVLLLALSNLNLFYIEKVSIEPVGQSSLSNIDERELQRFMTKYMGKRIWELSISKVEKDLYRNFPFIKKVYVTKRIPDKLVLRIEERVPALTLVVQAHVGAREDEYLIDTKGWVLGWCNDMRELCDSRPSLYLSERLVSVSVNSQLILPERSQLIELIQLHTALGFKVQKYFLPVSNVVCAYLESKSLFIFSTEKPISTQITELQLTLKKLKSEGKKYLEIDLRYDRPVVRFDKYTTWVTE